ncbi:MAG: heme exporter protein CcmB [Geminicoccaceae bacterium]
MRFFWREWLLIVRGGGQALQGVLFFLLALSLFPLGVGPSPEVLQRLGVGVIWVLALFAVMINLDQMYSADAADGSLDLMAMSPMPLELLVLAKAFAHWLASGFLLSLFSPVLAVMMGLPGEAVRALPLALLLGTPTLTLIGSIGAALLIRSRQGGVLLALIVLPLFIPVMIMGVSVVDARVMGLDAGAPLLLLGAMLLAAVALTPFATAMALRLSLG